MWAARYISTVVWHSLRMRHGICLELVGGLLAAGSLFGIGVAPVLAAATSVTPCVLPADLIRLDRPLKRTAHHLASGDLIVIVALGSSSTAGAGASSAAATYPSRLAVELAQRFPSQPIMVLNRGISGERAIDMLARFDKSVVAEHPDLVLWQGGIIFRTARLRTFAIQLIDPRRHKANEGHRRRCRSDRPAICSEGDR